MCIICNFKKNAIKSIFTRTSPEKLLALSEKKLIPLFKKTAKEVPAYKQLLQERKINPEEIRSTASFKKLVPVIDKGIFAKYGLAQLCRRADLTRLESLMVSSGTTGDAYAYGLSARGQFRSFSSRSDLFLDIYFNTRKKKTFLISTLSSGTKTPACLPLAETSVRADMVIEIVKKVIPHYQQVIIVGNPYFLKKVLEDGIAAGIKWGGLDVNLIMGEDWVPENFRDYLASLLGINTQKAAERILVSFGACELGYPLFMENSDTIRIRRLAGQDEKFRHAFFGEDAEICPELFVYQPHSLFLEEIGAELVFTPLEKNRLIPLIRYASGDLGKAYTYNRVKELLGQFQYADYLPKWKLPMVAVAGRKAKYIEIAGRRFTPEQVKSGIYSDFALAGATTGYFRISNRGGMNGLKIEIQLKEALEPAAELRDKFYRAISSYLHTEFELVLYPFGDFPYGMGLIYEYKYKYI